MHDVEIDLTFQHVTWSRKYYCINDFCSILLVKISLDSNAIRVTGAFNDIPIP